MYIGNYRDCHFLIISLYYIISNKVMVEIKALIQALTEKVLTGWGGVQNHGIELVYYGSEVSVNNPSGTTDNIKYVYYTKKALSPSGDKWKYAYKKELTYDANDNVLTVRTTIA